jgi:uncharacterized protein (TIGR03067 family)
MLVRISFPFLGLLLLSPSLLADDEKQPKKGKAPRDEAALQELVKFQGSWTVESMELNGERVPAGDLKGRTMFFGGDVFILRKGTEMLQVGMQKLDPAKSPRTVNATISQGLYQGEAMLGIYEFEGSDKLKVCFEIEGQTRPKEFKSAAGEGRFVAIYKRVPPPADEKDDIAGKYESVSVEMDGTEHKAEAEITRQGDAYLVRYTKGNALAYVGIGLRRGSMFSVTWANRGEVGLSVYRIEKDGKLLGEYTQLGAIGIVNVENLVPKKEKPEGIKTAEKAERE